MKTKKAVMLFILAVGILLPAVYLLQELSRPPVDDIWYNTMDLGIALSILIPLIFAEIQIYCSCLYFFSGKHKTPWKTVFNVFICVVSSALILTMIYAYFNFRVAHEYVIVILFLLSIALRVTDSVIGSHLDK